MLRRLSAFVIFSLLAALVGAGFSPGVTQASLGVTPVLDIYPGTYESMPLSLTNVNGTLFFSAKDLYTGRELWKSDGTFNGTSMVKNICPGASSSSPALLTNVNGTLFFRAYDPTHGWELWKSDGTSAGTVLVKDIYPGSGPSMVNHLTDVNGTLFFTADNGTSGTELWKSDGSAAGTVLVKDIGAGSSGSSPKSLTSVNGTLFFSADDGSHGRELWKSDGTAGGTVMVKDIFTGSVWPQSYPPDELTNVNGTLFFQVNDGTHGVEPWKSDGTAAGTIMVKDVYPGGSSYASDFLNVNGTVFFGAFDGVHGKELWKSDGTSSGTVLVKDIVPGSDGLVPYQFTKVGSTVFFTPGHIKHGVTLYKSDGTAAGTGLVKDINPGCMALPPRLLTPVDGMLFFVADDGSHGDQVWKSDGTASGTVMVRDIVYASAYASANASLPHALTNVNGTLFFTGDDGLHGDELWKSDGTEVGTVMVKDINATGHDSCPAELTEAGGTLFFTADDGVHGTEVWKSDGTAAGTAMVKDIESGSGSSSPFSLVSVNGTLFFFTVEPDPQYPSGTISLWKTDGTDTGTAWLGWWPYSDIGDPYWLDTEIVDVQGTAFFQIDVSDNQSQLWKSDGTAAGTVKVKEINAAGYFSCPPELTDVNGTLFFTGGDADHGSELWKSDGTENGTLLVKDICPGSNGSCPWGLTNLSGMLYFSAWDGTHGWELWKSDGTETGTALVKDINHGSADSWPGSFSEYKGELFFHADDSVHGSELWKTDGTGAGTVMVKDIDQSTGGSSYPVAFKVVDGILFFAADDGVNGTELWKSNGTGSGTVMVKDIRTGSNGSAPYSLTECNGMLFFGAYSDASGLEIWRTDGTAGGTVLVGDVNPGTDGSGPTDLTAVGDTLFFSATEENTGDELWKCSPDAMAGIAIEKLVNGQDADTEPGPYIRVGDAVFWEYVVTNTGTVTLTNVSVTDDPSAPIVYPDPKPLHTLLPGQSMVCWASGTAVAGQYENTATVSGTPPGGLAAISATDTSHYFGADPSIDIEKSVGGQDADSPPGPYFLVGENITLEYVISNTGNVPLGDIVLEDDSGVVVGCPATTLEPGDSMVCTANITAGADQQGEIAKVVGVPPGNLEPVMDADPAHYFGASPSVTIETLTNGHEADTAPGPYAMAGSPVFWEYVVINTGDVTLTHVTVSDNSGVTINYDPENPTRTLAPGQPMICWASATAVAGQYQNEGTAVGVPPGGLERVGAADPSHYFGAVPSITIEKSVNGDDADIPPGPYVLVEDTVMWEYQITNNGNVPLVDITISDGWVDIHYPTRELGAGESMVCTANTTAGADQHGEIAEVVGIPPGDLEPVTHTDPAHYFGASPSITIETLTNGDAADTAPGPYVMAGSPVFWEYVVINTGDVTLTDVTVSDNSGVTINYDPENPTRTLAPGQPMICWASGTAVAGQYQNEGTAVGVPPGGLERVGATDPSHYFGFEGPPPPVISCFPESGLRFSAREGENAEMTKTVVIENTGEEGCLPLEWVAYSDAEWLTLSDAGGVTPGGEQHTMVVLVDPSGMTAGTYYATITIVAPDAANTPEVIEVVLVVKPDRRR